MEQVIHTFGLDWKLLLIQTANFLLLLVILKRFLYKPLLAFIEKRQEVIVKGVEDAALAKRALAEASASAEALRAEAHREAEKLSSEARRHAEEKKEAILKDAALRAAELERDALRAAEEAKARALRESEEEVVKLSLLAAEKVLAERVGGHTKSHAR